MDPVDRLNDLAQNYKTRAKESQQWYHYLKAHGLANCSLALNPCTQTKRMIYDIEKQWYNDEHPLTFEESEALTVELKDNLRLFRNETKSDFDRLASREKEIKIDESMYGNKNTKTAHSIALEIFASTKKCTDGLINFSNHMVQSSVDILSTAGIKPPCEFAVIGTGSLARGEATPYSDVEYAIVIENRSGVKYFEKLAVDTYFRIGNLGETPIKCFGVEEIAHKEEPWKSLFSSVTVGYKIDGISSNAGNIPTGLPDGQSLILTVDEMVELYEKELKAPAGKLAGDMADLLSSSELIYSSDKGRGLFNELQKRMRAKLASAGTAPSVIKKRLETVKKDIDRYDFPPEFKSFGPPDNTNIEIKTDIFRYPTLLANHMKLSIAHDAKYPWEVHSHLQDQGILPHDTRVQMDIILALSIYIRTSAYLHMGTQGERLTLYHPMVSLETQRYHASRSTFVFLSCLVIPLKKLVLTKMNQRLQNATTFKNVKEAMLEVMRDLKLEKPHFMLKVKMLFFTGNYAKALQVLYDIIGEKDLNNDCEQVLKHLTSGKDTDKSRGGRSTRNTKKKRRASQIKVATELSHDNTRSIEIISYLLWSAGKHEVASRYIKLLITYHDSSLETAKWKILAADCLTHSTSYKEAARLLEEVLKYLLEQHGLSQNHSLLKHVLKQTTDFPLDKNNECLQMREIIIHTYRVIGDLCLHLKLYQQAREIMNMTKELWQAFMSESINIQDMPMGCLGVLYMGTGEYDKCVVWFIKRLVTLKRLHGKNTAHPDIAAGHKGLGDGYHATTAYSKALREYEKCIDIHKVLQTSDAIHPAMRQCLDATGDTYSAMDRTEKALEYYHIGLEANVDQCSANTTPPRLASSFIRIAKVNMRIEKPQVALHLLKKALKMIRRTCNDPNHPKLAAIIMEIGKVHLHTGNKVASLDCHDRSIAMIMSYHTQILPQMKNLLKTCSDMNEYTDLLHAFTMNLNLEMFSHGEDFPHPDIADGLQLLGLVHEKMGNYPRALISYSKSLEMRKAVYGEEAKHLDIAESCNAIGGVHGYMGDFTKALLYFNMSLNINVAVYGKRVAHPDIASTVYNIGKTYSHTGDYTRAQIHCLKSLHMRKTVYGENANHPDIACNYGLLGIIMYRQNKDYIRALDYHTKSLNMRKAVFGEIDNPYIADSHSNIGNVCRSMGNSADALDHYTKGLHMYEAVYGKRADHLDIARNYLDLGGVHGDIGDRATALSYYTKSLDMMKAIYGSGANHPVTALIYYNLAGAHSDEPTRSLEYYTKSLNMLQSLYGTRSNHPHIIANRERIARIGIRCALQWLLGIIMEDLS